MTSKNDSPIVYLISSTGEPEQTAERTNWLDALDEARRQLAVLDREQAETQRGPLTARDRQAELDRDRARMRQVEKAFDAKIVRADGTYDFNVGPVCVSAVIGGLYSVAFRYETGDRGVGFPAPARNVSAYIERMYAAVNLDRLYSHTLKIHTPAPDERDESEAYSAGRSLIMATETANRVNRALAH